VNECEGVYYFAVEWLVESWFRWMYHYNFAGWRSERMAKEWMRVWVRRVWETWGTLFNTFFATSYYYTSSKYHQQANKQQRAKNTLLTFSLILFYSSLMFAGIWLWKFRQWAQINFFSLSHTHTHVICYMRYVKVKEMLEWVIFFDIMWWSEDVRKNAHTHTHTSYRHC
jgi:hypothetical protein